MHPNADVIVVGLGAMGAASAGELAGRGLRVLGLDRFSPPHDRGSSHGTNRVVRQAYYEAPTYVPLLLRAYELWRELEADSATELLTITGGLMLGRPESEVVAGSLLSARRFGLPHELLDAREIRRRFPPFRPTDATVAVHEPNAGFVRPEAAIRALLDRAVRRGATLRFEEPALRWEAGPSAVRVTTPAGSFEAAQLVVSAGAWVGPFLSGVALPVTVERQVQYWFEPEGPVEAFAPGRFPIWLWETADGAHPYGLPALDRTVKVALHHGGVNRACSADTVDRVVTNAEIEAMRACLRGCIPALAGRCAAAVPCLYTSTPDGHFVLDRHPAHRNVWIVSPCSGHGFKFSPVIGEIVATLVADGRADHDLEPFRLSRF